jgi:hypothetical protein
MCRIFGVRLGLIQGAVKIVSIGLKENWVFLYKDAIKKQSHRILDFILGSIKLNHILLRIADSLDFLNCCS